MKAKYESTYRDIIVDEYLFYRLLKIGQVLRQHGKTDGSFNETIAFLLEELFKDEI